jgi:peptide/nickel transport system substrate-binding protein
MTIRPIDRRLLLRTGAAAGLGSFTVLRGAAAQDPRTLVVAGDSDIDTLDPHVFKSVGAYGVQANIYDSPLSWRVRPVEGRAGLARSQPGEYEPGIAEAWSFENDGATIVLTLRQGLRFPSGRPVDAAALKYSFDRALQSPGYMRVVLPLLTRIGSPDAFEVRDPRTIAVKMPGPTPLGIEVLALITNSLLDPDLVQQHVTAADPWAADWLKRNAAGLGPYTLTKNEPGVEVVLEATPGHWREPHFRRVVIKFIPSEADRVLLLRRRAVDMIVGRPGLSPRSVRSLDGAPGLQTVNLPDTICHWLSMNCQKPPFDNPKVRLAVNYAIPIQAILPNVLQGFGAQMKSPLPALMPGHDGTLSPFSHDIEKGRALLREAGLGAAPIPVTLAIRVGWQPHEQAATWLQPELEKLGFRVTLARETDAAFRQTATRGDHQLAIESWQSWVNDPFFHLFFNFHSRARGTNTSFYANPAMDALIDANMHETNTEKRLAAAREAQRLLIADGVWGFLWVDNWTRVARADLTGIEKRWDTFDRFYNLRLG